MKQFHVYGIGNALVDIDIEVSESTIQQLNIAKGVMTLIDEDTHHHLLKELHGIEHLKACGGSAANTLFTLQQMGAKTFYSCKIGNDDAGDFFYDNLTSHGIQTNANECIREGVTGKCIVLVTPDADRTMNTFLGATSKFSKVQLAENALKNAEFLYIEGYLVATELGREASILAREMAERHQVKIALSLSDPNMVTYFKEGLCSIIGEQIDILFCNESEALLFTGAADLTIARERLKQYARTLAITMGDKGVLIFNGHEFLHIPAYKVPVIDTVGAGDVFAGIFLYAITHGYGYFDAGELANYAASKVVGKFGPRLNQKEIDDVREVIARQAAYA